MKVACLYSGGKDSTYAAWIALSQGYEVETLVTAFPKKESFMFHHPNVKWCALQAEALEIPITFFQARKGEEEEIEDLKNVLSKLKIDAVVSGAIASEYQKEKIDWVGDELGIKSFAPLWHKNQKMLLKEMVESGMKIVFSGVSAEGLGKEWLGKELDEKALKKLEETTERYGLNPAFEGGEAETFVVDAPFFKKKIEIKKAEKEWDGSSGVMVIEEAELAEK